MKEKLIENRAIIIKIIAVLAILHGLRLFNTSLELWSLVSDMPNGGFFSNYAIDLANVGNKIASFAFAHASVYVVAVYGLWKLKEWGRGAVIIISIFNIIYMTLLVLGSINQETGVYSIAVIVISGMVVLYLSLPPVKEIFEK